MDVHVLLACRAVQLSAGAYAQRVAGEDDYDDDEEPSAAPAPAAARVPALPGAGLQLPGGMIAAGLPAQQLSALQQPGLQLHPLQVQQLQLQQQAAHASALPAPALAAELGPAAPAQQQQPRRPQLTPEQERLRLLNMATPGQEALQDELSFVYLDLDELGEDIVHFSELFGFTDNMIKVGGSQMTKGRGRQRCR